MAHFWKNKPPNEHLPMAVSMLCLPNLFLLQLPWKRFVTLTTENESIQITFIGEIIVLLTASCIKIAETPLDLGQSAFNTIDQGSLKLNRTPETHDILSVQVLQFKQCHDRKY